MKRNLGQVVTLSLVGTLLCSTAALAQRAPVGNWTSSGNDPGQSGWQKSESVLNPANTPEKFKFLWKLNLGPEGKNGLSYSEPLLAPRLINAQGFKDIVFTGGTDTLYAVDSELGVLLWKKKYEEPATSGACATGISMVMEPPAVINFGARRAPGAPAPPPPPPPPPPSARRLGGSAGGGGFTLKAIYALTNDGMLHGQVLTTGADYGPPVKFLPSAGAGATGLSLIGKTVYTITSHNCGGIPNALWAMDMTTESYPVTSYKTSALGFTGPTLTETTAYVVAGSGTSDHANSVVGIAGKDMAAQDWYTPASGKLGNVTPVAFTYKTKKLIAAPGPDGSFVLLDGDSLGGTDHHTPLFQTEKISSAKEGAWDSLATWQDATGNGWVLASVSGPIAAAKFAVKNGAVTHGGVVAFRVEEKDGKMVLTPEWVSQDMVNPSAPRIANGVVIALSQGDAATHATLLVVDAASGKQLFTSGNSISTYAHLAGVSIGDSHVFFTTHDNTLYSFGIGIEH